MGIAFLLLRNLRKYDKFNDKYFGNLSDHQIDNYEEYILEERRLTP
eukprot:CAMPEP_0168620652 /NCGR_PEP_ID=MMETSP0449_2-20121227/7260_1 /TAXON_ID=1082188 /ORGANISM="Strombidium rassoulzadegani, Strain ras09" /LENGTH=45 /DNA_ID= /DNA_START= /DNA_END= /DNA_ORIENTATION=